MDSLIMYAPGLESNIRIECLVQTPSFVEWVVPALTGR